jgi:hypothetical protein
MKRASRAGSSLLEVSDGRDLSSLLWPRRAQKNRGRLLYSQYRGAEARERDPDLSDDDHRPVGSDIHIMPARRFRVALIRFQGLM